MIAGRTEKAKQQLRCEAWGEIAADLGLQLAQDLGNLKQTLRAAGSPDGDADGNGDNDGMMLNPSSAAGHVRALALLP